MKIVLAQINPTVGDLDYNTNLIIENLQKAKRFDVDVIVFPELAITGYPPEDLLLFDHFIDAAEKQLLRIVKESNGICVIVGTPRRTQIRGEKHLHNSAAIIEDGLLLGYHDKLLLPTYDVFDERRYFEPGVEIALWKIKGKTIAITICEDIWHHSGQVISSIYTRDPIHEITRLKPDVTINLSASPFSGNKPETRFQVCSKAALAIGSPFLLCNCFGGNDSLIFDGHSLFLDKKGALISRGTGFEEDFMICDLAETTPSQLLGLDPIEEIYEALKLGVRDYFRKQGFTHACIGLSGGIDSAVAIALVSEAIGNTNVKALLMPSRFSSEESVTDSIALAKNLRIPHEIVSIEKPFQAYLDLLEPNFQGRPFDSTEENLQARIRGMILMAYSNKFGYIVIGTGNKSELAMGYSTLYGDMCGGIGVIADVTKGQVYALANWINRKSPIIPQNILSKPPSAELRPNQKDADSLPDYEIIDTVVREYVEQHKDPRKIAETYHIDPELVKYIIRKIHLNEYKRRQGPLILRVSEKAFSAGRRFPVVHNWEG
ncbi:MAG: NAD+ synthase [Chlamydiales bacterium]